MYQQLTKAEQRKLAEAASKQLTPVKCPKGKKTPKDKIKMKKELD